MGNNSQYVLYIVSNLHFHIIKLTVHLSQMSSSPSGCLDNCNQTPCQLLNYCMTAILQKWNELTHGKEKQQLKHKEDVGHIIFEKVLLFSPLVKPLKEKTL